MTLARAHDTLVGRSLGEFVLRERIGEGGFGAVYRANQPALDREAVVKVLHSKLHAAPGAAERFLREAKLASKLDHPYAAHIYAFGREPDGELWIAMEYVRGTPLDQVLKHQGPIPLERFTQLLDRLCEVIQTAHEANIVHRDIKPANVMVLSRAGRLLPKLLDFGIAKGLQNTTPVPDDLGGNETMLAKTGDTDPESLAQTFEAAPPLADQMALDATAASGGPGLTQRGAIMGSPPYMAPEQWLDAGQVGPATDLYALGALAYECLTGEPPFTGQTVGQIAVAHAKQAPPPLGARFPAALDKVFLKVLAKRADERYPDALAFAAAFRAAAGVTRERVQLPALAPEVRDAAVNDGPQPIAEALAAYEAARNAHQARDALSVFARTVARYVGLLAVACRARVATEGAGSELLRELARRTLSDGEWLELARQLTRTWISRREAYPLPELIAAIHDTDVIDDLDALSALRAGEATDEDALAIVLEAALGRVAKVVRALAFVNDYPLVVAVNGGLAERWTGLRRTRRTTLAVRGKTLSLGAPALLDRDGAPVLSLAPLFQVAAPTPGAPADLFLFEGRDRRGAKLVALPAGFEHHDDALWQWFRLQLGAHDEGETLVGEEQAPYRGLSAFSSEDGALFYGREKQVDAFVNRLQLQPLLAVVGRSGAGKSSFVHAGVLPALPAGTRTITMRPGVAPLATLTARLEQAQIRATEGWKTGEWSNSGTFGHAAGLREVLARDRDALGHLLRVDAAKRGPIVLVIDQLEEMFTLCQDADERRVFAEAVSAAARTPEDPVRVIFTLRDDFLVRTEQVPALRNRIGQGLQLLTVPNGDDLHRILVEPARRAGYEFEDAALPKEMVDEVAEQPGALALLSFTAARLWELRDRQFRQLTRAAYKSLGGVGGALAQHAETTLEAMPPDERTLTREAFRHLVTSQATRAVLGRSELHQLLGSDERAQSVIEKLVAARLLVASENESGGETIEVVHEALLVAWPRLVDWRSEDSEGARFREQLRSAAKQWDERGRPRGALWRGDAFGDFTRWRARHAGPLTELEGAFADASARDAARGRRNGRLLVASAFVVLGAVVIGLVVFNTRIADEKRTAERANTELQTNLRQQWEAQGRLHVLTGDPLKGLAALAYAAQLGESGWAHDFLVAEAIRATGGAQLTLRHGGPVRAPKFSPDGTRIVTGSVDGKARIWDAKTGALLLELTHGVPVARTAFSPDSSTLLTASFDGTARLWDVKTGKELHRVTHGKNAWCVAYSHDGAHALSAGDDDTVVMWSVASGAVEQRVHGAGAGMHACAFASDGAHFAASDDAGVTRVWDARTAALVATHSDQQKRVNSLVFSPDNARLLAASTDGTAAEWDVSRGALLHRYEHHGEVSSAEYSPDGTRVVTASLDGTAAVWDAATGARMLVLAGHAGGVTRARFSPDGRFIATSSEDSSARLWDAVTGRVVATWQRHDGDIVEIAFDPTGHRAITASDDDTAIVWNARPELDAIQVVTPIGTSAAAFSRDGALLALGNSDGTTTIWNARDGEKLATVGGRGERIADLAFDTSGRRLAVARSDASISIWNLVAPQKPALELRAPATVLVKMAWSRDDAMLAVGTSDGYVRMWNATTGEHILERVAHGGETVAWVAFGDGTLAVVTYDGFTQLWDLTGKELSHFQDPDLALSAIPGPDGKRLLTGTFKRTVKIRDLDGGHAVTLLGHLAQVSHAAWHSAGRLVITSAPDGTARMWDAQTGDELSRITGFGHEPCVDFAADGHYLIAGDNGIAIVGQLPEYNGDAAAFQKLIVCRVPYVVVANQLEPRERERAGCDGL